MKSLTLEEHRQLLNDLHHEIENQGSELHARAYEALLWLTLEYLRPDFSPEVKIVGWSDQ